MALLLVLENKSNAVNNSVNACQTFSLTYRCTGVPKIVYMVTS